MSEKKFEPPLQLKLLEQNYQFSSMLDFNFALDGRCSLTSKKLDVLFKLTGSELTGESKKITEVNQTLFFLVTEMVEDPDCIVSKFRDLEPTLF